MQALQLEIPNDIVLSLKIPYDQMKERLQEELAIDLYAQGYLSFGKARILAGLSKWEFADRLGKRDIPRHYTPEMLEEDMQFAYED